MQIGISNYAYPAYASRGYSSAPARCGNCRPCVPAARPPQYGPGGPAGPAPVADPRGGPFQQFVDGGLRSVFQNVAPAFPQGNSALGQLASDPRSSTLVGLLGGTGLTMAVSDLEQKGPVTVLAPTNAAFEKLSQESPELFSKLTNPANLEALQKILLYHASSEPFGLQSGQGFDSLQEQDGARFFGNPFFGRIQNGGQWINTGTARLAANGSLVIPVDQVLIPPDFDPSTLK